MKIVKKAWPEYFEAVLQGKKNFDLRLADWECQEGDILVLKEWDPQTRSYTGRVVSREVTYVAKFKLEDMFWEPEEIKKHGIQVISLKPSSED